MTVDTAARTPRVVTRTKLYPPTSAVARALNVVGDKWALLVVKAIADAGAPVRFVTLHRDLLPGVSTEQLRTCLARLQAAGILTRTRYREVPPRVDYELTDKGLALRDVFGALATWADAWETTGG